jgi:hypothetical protein
MLAAGEGAAFSCSLLPVDDQEMGIVRQSMGGTGRNNISCSLPLNLFN